MVYTCAFLRQNVDSKAGRNGLHEGQILLEDNITAGSCPKNTLGPCKTSKEMEDGVYPSKGL